MPVTQPVTQGPLQGGLGTKRGPRDHDGTQGPQQDPIILMGPGNHGSLIQGAQGPQWGLETTMGPQEHKGEQGPRNHKGAQRP